MAVIITDMDMPKCCKDCIFWNYYEGYCRIIIPSKWKDFDIDEEYEKRADGFKSVDEMQKPQNQQEALIINENKTL